MYVFDSLYIRPVVHRFQVGRQNAAECMPLIMEPESAFYTDPVLVLDFQSLYPSIMIANNVTDTFYLFLSVFS